MARRGRSAAARAEEDFDDDASDTSGRTQPKERMTVFLSRLVRRKLRVASAVMDRDMSEVIEDAVETYIEAYERERAAKGLPPLTIE
jgi:hypothetical protein